MNKEMTLVSFSSVEPTVRILVLPRGPEEGRKPTREAEISVQIGGATVAERKGMCL